MVTETRVYVVNKNHTLDYNSMSDDEFMAIAETAGNIWTIDGFVEYFNTALGYAISSNWQHMRIINVETI